MPGANDGGVIETDGSVTIELDDEIDNNGEDTVAGGERNDREPPKPDSRASDGNEDDGDDGDLTPEERRARRREQGQRRRDNRRQFAMQDNMIIKALTDTVQRQGEIIEQVNGRMVEMDRAATVAGRDREARNYHRSKAAYAKAVEEGRGEDAAAFMTQMNTAERNYHYFENQISRSGAERQEDRSGQQTEQQKPDAAADEEATVERNRNFFMERHPDYVPGGKDAYSVAIRKLDSELASEGYKASTKAYWEELEERIKEESIKPGMKAEDDEDDRQQGRDDGGRFKPKNQNRSEERRGPATGGRGSGGKNTITVPAEVKAQMVEAGIWEDPVRRNKVLREYAANLEKNK